MTKALRLVFFDQLSQDMLHFDGASKEDYFFFFESKRYCCHVPHHKKKLVFWIASMRHFAEKIRKKYPLVLYHDLDAPDADLTLEAVLAPIVKQYEIEHIVCSEPSEFDLLEQVNALSSALSISVTVLEDNRFYASKAFFSDWIATQKKPMMEYFYRKMRQAHGILINHAGKPEGGRWNYDKENRGTPDGTITYPSLPTFKQDSLVEEAIGLVEKHFSNHFGSIQPFYFAVTQDAALASLHDFIAKRLPLFGQYQDAMVDGEAFLFHSHLSPYLNNGLLHPKVCVDAAVAAYARGDAPLNAVEGFVRQILGWREYMRGMYWHHMPSYREKNFFGLTRKLPDFFWTGKTKMACMRAVVEETQAHAYAHHIQRLMVVGNLSLLLGLDPDAVQSWFWVVYADAYEWVHLPNVFGMGIFADGGLLATKPYLSSGAYINKLSNYCQGCRYDVKKKVGVDACPFNFSYWPFLEAHRDRLAENPRMGMMYRIMDNMDPKVLASMKQQHGSFIQELLDEAF